MLEGAQERVGLVQRLAVLAPDVAAPGQLGERAQRRRRADPLVGAAVHELQQLDGELDVAQPAGAELELPLGLARPGCGRPPGAASPGCPRRSRRARRPSTPSARPSRRTRRPSVEVAGDRTGLEQRLELPGLGPPLVVAAVAGERADQRPGLALGPQGGVDRPDRALAGVVGADLHQVAGQLGRGPSGRRVVGALGRLVDEDHVDVGDVVELVAAALAHRDHRQPRRSTPPRPPAAGRPPARPRACRRRGRRARRRRRRRPRSWARSRAASRSSTPAVLHPQRVDRLGVGHAWRPAPGRAGRRRPPRSSPSRTANAAGRVEPSVGSVSSRQCSGWRQQVVGRAPRSRRARRAAASRCPRRRPAPRAAPSRSSTGLGQPDQLRPAPGRGRRCAPRRATSGSAGVPERGEVLLGARVGVGEAEPGQVCPGRWSGRLMRPRSPAATSAGEARRRAAARPRPARPGPPSMSASSASASSPRSASVGRARRRSTQAPTIASSTSGCRCTPHTAGREPGRLHLAVGGRGQHDRARRAARSTTSLFHCTPAARRGATSAEQRVRRPRPRSSRRRARPICWPRGFAPTAPPSATAASWCPRQIPSVGSPVAAAAADQVLGRRQPPVVRRRRRRPSRRRAPPARRSPSRSSGSASPAYGRRTSSAQPASTQPARRRAPGGHVRLVLDDQDPRASAAPASEDRAASGRARRPRPGRGTRPTPRACCAGRSRRRARPASRRAARSSRRSRWPRRGSWAAARCRGCLRSRSVSDHTSSSASRGRS